jgi:hypothetical protein
MSVRSPERTRRGCARRVLPLVLVALLALPALLASCGGNADPFAGLYWEPSSGRRIEIKHDDGRYQLYYGSELRAHTATRDGDQLVIADPMGGQTVVRAGVDEGTLELVTGGETTLLKPLPQHQ